MSVKVVNEYTWPNMESWKLILIGRYIDIYRLQIGRRTRQEEFTGAKIGYGVFMSHWMWDTCTSEIHEIGTATSVAFLKFLQQNPRTKHTKSTIIIIGSTQVFGSREELTEWVQTLAKSLGFVVVTRRSNKKSSGFVFKVVLKCDRGREYTGLNSSRATGTKRIKCPFELQGNYSKQHNSWILRVISDKHNHQPIRYMEGHPYVQRLSDNEFRLVEDLYRMNMAPKDIFSVLKQQYPNNVSTMSTIYNALKKIRLMETGCKSPMQVLMSLLNPSGYIYYSTTTTSNELNNLFFVHPISYNIWRAFPHVLIIDATYKTNPYKMPFVEIVGVTSTSKTFCIAFAFIYDEKTVNYRWVLECLKLTLGECMLPRVIVTDKEMALINACKVVFPDTARLLCRWHIHRNIIGKWKRSFSSKRDWNEFFRLWELLENSSTLKSYTDNYHQLESFLKHLNRTRILNYVNKLGWINSRKRLYLSGLINIFTLEIPEPTELRGNISNEALNKMLKDRERFMDHIDDCDCRLRTSCGLPCACEISMYITSQNYIPLSSIDVFWRKLDISPLVCEQDDDVSCDNELKHFAENFNKQSKNVKKSWLKKLKDIINPGKTETREPQVKKNNRGRPTTKKTQQKKRDDYVHQDSRRYSCSDMPNFVGKDSVKDPARHSSYDINLNEEPEIDLNEEPEIDLNDEPKIDLNEVPYEFSSSYIFNQNEMPRMRNSHMFNGIPKLLHPYIKNIYNVEGDGNCGYRAFAVSLWGNEHLYENIRFEMKEELQNKLEFYKSMFEREIKSLNDSLCFVGSPCPPDY
ncbi:uncharacterized protein [Rutidosis leptorrhynchoides]|uniref:uncharacterized protein n=1 Tax=Rutidosis leptorrhynchoides TaxID=125765 RepID=UPI003A99045A